MAKYRYSSIREALGLTPLFFLDQDIIRLVGETPRFVKGYKEFLYEQNSEDIYEFDKLFSQEEAVLGKDGYGSFSAKKYLRRKAKNKRVASLD